MALPWKIIDQFFTEDEGKLELRQRGKKDFIITLGPQVLMNSMAQRSEIALGKLGAGALENHPAPRVLLGGLGMGITLRAVLDCLPETAKVMAWELNPKIYQWCQGELSDLNNGAVTDHRVCIKVGDVARGIKAVCQNRSNDRFDAIILDLYRGPHPRTDKKYDPIYGSRALEYTKKALNPGGVFAVWGENHDEGFMKRLAQAGFITEFKRPGKGGYSHAVFLASKKKTDTN
ncbi:MAG: spermidine synthase [Desulfobacteraceae bacterium]|nr:spermidine synthase [Desulfobacteraceae bacterium]